MSVRCGKPTPNGKPCRRKVTSAGAPCGAAHSAPLLTATPEMTAAVAGGDPLAAATAALPGEEAENLANATRDPGTLEALSRHPFPPVRWR